MRGFLFLLLAAFFASAFAQGDAWQVKKTEWSQADELGYQNFIRALGYVAFHNQCDTPDGACEGIGDLLGSRGNPYRPGDPAWVGQLHTDCADFPLTLRAYYAWKNFLPHAVASGVAPVGDCGVVRDTRFCKNGNQVVARREVKTGTPAKQVLSRWSVSPTTSIYRTHYLDEYGIGSDFYTPAIDRDGITPGTIIYNPNGHTSMVFDVLDDGRVLYLETDIGGVVRTGYLTAAKLPLKPDSQGWGFKKWKPLKVVGAKRDLDGNYVGGRTTLPRAPEVPGFSPEHYSGRVEGSGDRYRLGGELVPWHQFMVHRLARGPLQIDPGAEMQRLADGACLGVRDRVQAVERALQVGMHTDPHPERLPPNIYGTGGNWQWFHWESYSTPSRDAHIKSELKNILDTARGLIQRHRENDPQIIYGGSDIAADMLASYVDAARRCTLTYTNSDGHPVTLDLLDITERAFRLSFDPYHCVELRWGAAGEELASCPEDTNKMRWYENEQFLRNQIERRYEDRMDFTLKELSNLRPGNGVAEPPDIDVARYLKSQQQPRLALNRCSDDLDTAPQRSMSCGADTGGHRPLVK